MQIKNEKIDTFCHAIYDICRSLRNSFISSLLRVRFPVLDRSLTSLPPPAGTKRARFLFGISGVFRFLLFFDRIIDKVRVHLQHLSASTSVGHSRQENKLRIFFQQNFWEYSKFRLPNYRHQDIENSLFATLNIILTHIYMIIVGNCE